MLAVLKERPEPGIQVVERPKPSLGADDQVLIRVEGCGMCGSDLGFYRWDPHMLFEIQLPRILGHEVVGTVEEVGSRVRGFQPGDRVVTETWGGCGECDTCRIGLFNNCERQLRIGQRSDGGYASHVVVPFVSLYRIPPDMPLRQAVMIETVASALHGMERVSVTPGDRVLVMGPGPLGLSASMILSAGGAYQVRVTGLPTDIARLALGRELGIETLVADEGLPAAVREWTGGRGADVVLDASGGAGSLGEALQHVRKGGQIGVLGVSPSATLDPRPIVTKEVTIAGSFRRQPSSWRRSIRVVGSGAFGVARLATHVFPVTQAEQAFQTLQRREGVKVVITPEPA